MTAKELLSNYQEARKNYDQTVNEIIRHIDLINESFESQYPDYYIGHLYNVTSEISASVYRKSDNTIIDAFAIPMGDCTWRLEKE